VIFILCLKDRASSQLFSSVRVLFKPKSAIIAINTIIVKLYGVILSRLASFLAFKQTLGLANAFVVSLLLFSAIKYL